MGRTIPPQETIEMTSFRASSPALVDKLREQQNLSHSEAKEAVGQVFHALSALLEVDDAKVRVSGFGTFHNKFRAGREGKNPLTGETMQIADKYALTFKAGKKS
jgi:DNA-binding protein HU-beta